MQENYEKTLQITSEENEEKKTYINCTCFQVSVGIIYTYVYIFASILVNIINRVIFLTYKFKFNFFFLFLQQILLLIFFSIYYKKSKKFKEIAGEISLSDFLTHKYYYIIFSFVFVFNILSSFRANQELVNTTMFVTLRKFVLLMIFFIDFFFNKKKFTKLTILCVFLITGGVFVTGIGDMTTDVFGIFLVFLNNIATVIYIKFTESFRKTTGFSNLKLLVYNSYLINPALILLIFITDEHKKIYQYFYFNNTNLDSYWGLFFYISLSCVLCVILNSSFFLSNEKNSSILTQLLANSKDIFVSGLSFIMLKNNKFSVNKLFGLIISTIGAILISSKSIIDNLKLGFHEEKKYYIQLSDLTDDAFESNKL
jgi:drug/metabolite transporter (DMT)-like permease